MLVGGFGTRLRPLTSATPKQMLPVAHRPMIERVVATLGSHGVTEAVLSLGYRPDAFLAAYPDGRCAGVALRYVVEDEPLDTAGAVAFAAREAGVDDTFVVVNGDVLTDLDVSALWALHHERGAEGTIALTRVEDPSRFGVVATDEADRVTAFVEKPPADQAPSNWINAGTYVLEPSVVARVPLGARASIERQVFPAMVADGTLFARGSDAYWVDAGTPAAYLQVQLDLLDGVRGPAEAGVDPAAVVDPDARLARAVVMAGAEVAAGAEVRDSVVMGGARVEEGAVVERSIVGPGAVVGKRARLADLTVVGEGEAVEADADLRGARLPEEG